MAVGSGEAGRKELGEKSTTVSNSSLLFHTDGLPSYCKLCYYLFACPCIAIEGRCRFCLAVRGLHALGFFMMGSKLSSRLFCPTFICLPVLFLPAPDIFV